APPREPERQQIDVLVGEVAPQPEPPQDDGRGHHDEGRPAKGPHPSQRSIRLEWAAGSPQRSHVRMIALVKLLAYLNVLGFFEAPLARARMVMGTSTIRSRWRITSISSSEVQN